MFTALRDRLRTRRGQTLLSSWGSPSRSQKAGLDTAAKVAALKMYLESLSEDERAEYVAAAADFASAMNAVGANSIRSCYRGGSVRPGETPEGVRSIEEMRSLTRMLRSMPRKTTQEAPGDQRVGLSGDVDD